MKADSLEYELQPDDQLCFVRIPKTGSTTLISILDAQFNHEELCPIPVAEVPQISQSELAKYRLFRDHFDYDLRDFLLKPPIYITMLRHPIDRAISYYEFCKRGKNQTPFDNYMRSAAEGGLKAFICNLDPAIRIRNSNLQTRQIASGLGSRHSDPFRAAAIESQSDSDLLELAKSHLKEFKFVGLTERFQDSVLLLSYIFGWYPVAEYQSLRVASKKLRRDDLDQETVDAIVSVNLLDLELYKYAQQIFEQHFSQMLQALSKNCASEDERSPFNKDEPILLKLLDQHYQQRYADRNPTPVRSLDYNFLQAMSGSGWQRRNGTNSGLRCDSTPFCWTGPGTQSILDFSIATDTDLTIKLRIINAVASDVLESLTLEVNGQSIALEKLFHRGNITVLQGKIPQSVLISDPAGVAAQYRSFTRLTFNVNRTISLQEVNPKSADKRVVGLAFHRIQVMPASAQPGDLEYLYLLFPFDDRNWAETAEFLDRHLQPAEKLVAPDEFYEPFPRQFNDCKTSFSQIQPAWVVIHKGLSDEIDGSSLQWTMQNLVPVFANAVFVIFTSRLDIQPMSDRSPHLQTFWATHHSSMSMRIWYKVKAKIASRFIKNETKS